MRRAQITSHPARWTAIACGLFLLGFVILSYSAALSKNATIDEPAHAMSGWLGLRQDDFRVEAVNPPLWKCWAALGNLFSNPPLTHPSVIWKNQTWDPAAEVIWSSQTLYDSPGFNGESFINRSRAMMLVLGFLLGILIANWTYQIAGPIAAIVATALYCLDPTFIAHAPLIKSDVAFSLVLLLITRTIYKLGQQATLMRVLAVGLLCGIEINIKFSGLIVGPFLAIALLTRAIASGPWIAFHRSLNTRLGRLFLSAGIGFFAVLFCVGITWASYGFRYRPAPSPLVRMDMQAIYDRAQMVETTAALMRTPTAAEMAAHLPSSTFRFVRWANNRHLLPQAMLAGLLYQHSCVQIWPAFLNGELYGTGRWDYFPLALLYKTPVAELLIFVLFACATIRSASRRVLTSTVDLRWLGSCLLIPMLLFGIAALTTHLNIGLRNILPLLPFVFILCGCAAATAWKHRPQLTAVTLVVLLVLLMIETLSAWPNYIAFFNFPTGGEAGGLAHLSDSNLDWGQDIKTLARWQTSHRDQPLFARLYETVDPEYYGLKFHPLSIDQTGNPESDIPMNHGYLAVSATHLQGLYIRPWEKPFYDRLRQSHPIAILGGTIYLYELRP